MRKLYQFLFLLSLVHNRYTKPTMAVYILLIYNCTVIHYHSRTHGKIEDSEKILDQSKAKTPKLQIP